MTRRRIGISYSRLSDPKQAKGDGENRQEQDYRAFCGRHNLTPLAEVFADRCSGYKDEHRKRGRLGQLIALAKDGAFEPGTVIVVEAWDRLGRLRPDKQTKLVAELLETGVHIGICRLDDIFTEADFGTHKWTTLAVFVQLAYQESLQKADRVARSWKSRREKARELGRLITGQLPAWLECVHGQARPVPERVAAVRRVFALAGQGLGLGRTVAALVREAVPALGRGGRWNRTYLHLLLSDRRVLGEHQPCTADGKPAGDAIADYFPAVVTAEEWALARAGQEQRQGRDRRGRVLARSERKHVNLFRGLLTHAPDGEGFFFQPGTTAKKVRHAVLRSKAGSDSRGKEVTFPYLVFEEAVLSLLAEVDPKEVLRQD